MARSVVVVKIQVFGSYIMFRSSRQRGTLLFSIAISFSLFATVTTLRGQELTTAQRSTMCSSKSASLNRLLAEAGPKRERLQLQIQDAERMARNVRLQRDRLLISMPPSEARKEINDGLNSTHSQMRKLEHDAANARQQKQRDDARAELEKFRLYRDFLASLLAHVESSGMIAPPSPDKDPFIATFDRRVRQLSDSYDQIGSDINILQQSIESLRCGKNGGGESSGDRFDAEAASGGEVRGERTPSTEVSPSDDHSQLPTAFRNKTVVRVEALDPTLECWAADAKTGCYTPNLEAQIKIYHFSDGSHFWDRREYDAKRREMAEKNKMVFRWACAKSLWRNGRCG